MQQHRIRVSIVGLAAEVYVCKHVAEETGGHYSVALNERHLERLLLDLVPPPPALAMSTEATLVWPNPFVCSFVLCRGFPLTPKA